MEFSRFFVDVVALMFWPLGGRAFARCLCALWPAAKGAPHSVLLLLSLPWWGLLAEAALLLLGASRGPFTPVPPALEQLSWHPLLAPLAWLCMALGLFSCWRPGDNGDSRRRGLWRDFVGPKDKAFCAPLLLLPACWLLPAYATDASLYHLSLPLHRLLGQGSPVGHGNAGFFHLADSAHLWSLCQGSLVGARAQQLWALVWAAEATFALCPGLGRGRAVAAQTLFLAAPVVLWQATAGYVDVLWTAYEAVALLLLWRAGGAKAHVYAPLGLWFVAAAVASKSLALPHLLWAWLGLLLRARGHRWPRRRARRLWLHCGLASFVPWAGFVLRNLLRYHSPLFPFTTPWWPTSWALRPAQWTTLMALLQAPGPVDATGQPLLGWAALWRLPGALIFSARFSSPAFDGVLGPLPLLLPLAVGLGSLRAWRRPGRHVGPAGRTKPRRAAAALRAWVGTFVALRLAVWLASSWQARFLLAPLWWCCLFWAAGGARGLVVRSGATRASADAQRLRWALAFLATLCFWPSLRGHLPAWDGRAFGPAAARQAHRLAVLPGTALCDAPFAWDAGKTLLVWTQRQLLWCLGPAHSDSYDEAATLMAALDAAGRPAAAAQLLRQQGIFELLVHEDLLAHQLRWGPAVSAGGQAPWAARARAWTAFRAEALQERARRGGLVRYRLLDVLSTAAGAPPRATAACRACRPPG